MSLHARLYAARAVRMLQEQERAAERLRVDAPARPHGEGAGAAPVIPSPRRPPTDRDPAQPGVVTEVGTAD